MKCDNRQCGNEASDTLQTTANYCGTTVMVLLNVCTACKTTAKASNVYITAVIEGRESTNLAFDTHSDKF